MPQPRRIPVVVLSGGLGSGKTTLLNHLLGQGMGRVGVIINDFGAVNIDALLVRGHVDAQAEIGGGCLCCLEDAGELDAALARMVSPALDLDVVLVEASGLAEPRALARMIVGSSVRGVRFGGVVEVVDAAAAAIAQDDGEELPVAADHVRVASLLVVNKADRVSAGPDGEARLARLERALRAVAPATPILRTSYGVVAPELLFDEMQRPLPLGQLSIADLLAEDLAATRAHGGRQHGGHCAASAHGHLGEEGEHAQHAHVHYASACVDDPRGVDPDALVAFLEARPPGLYRVKGEFWVPGLPGDFTVHGVGGWFAIERGSRHTSEERRTRLVAIGTGMATASVEADLAACLTGESALGPAVLGRFERYLTR